MKPSGGFSPDPSPPIIELHFNGDKFMGESKENKTMLSVMDKTSLRIIIIGALTILAFLGGKFTVKESTIETQGLMYWILKAREARGITTTTSQSKAVETSLFTDAAKLPVTGKLPRSFIVWVDDNPLNNQFERLAFSTLGIYTDAYTNNLEALEAIDRMVRNGTKPDLIISDINRDGKTQTGFDLLRDVTYRYPEIPFVFYSLSPPQEDIAKAQALGAKGLIEQPDELTIRALELTKNRQ